MPKAEKTESESEFKSRVMHAAQIVRERLARIENLRADEFDQKAPLVTEAIEALDSVS